jgi:MFS family permease
VLARGWALPGAAGALLSARLISSVGDSLSLVALMLHVAQSTGQALAVAALLLAGDFVPALLSPLTGAVSDRFDRRRVMITCELVQAGLLALIAIGPPPLPLLLGLVATRALTGAVFLAASRAALPALVTARDLERANSWLGFGTNSAEVVGPLLAAALLPLIEIRGVLLLDTASFTASALLLCRLPALASHTDRAAAPPGWLADARDGLGYLWSIRPVRTIALGFCGIVAVNGIDDVALVVLATETFRAGESAVALLLGAVGIGLLGGYALLAGSSGRVLGRITLPALLLTGFAVSSLGNLLTGLSWAVAVAFGLQAVRGLGLAAMDVASNTLLARLVPDQLLGRVFGNLYGLIGVAVGVSYLGGGLLLDAIGAPAVFVLAGSAGILITAGTALTLRRALPSVP